MDNFKINPIIKKPLCENCLVNHPRYRLVPIYYTNAKYGVTYNRQQYPSAMSEDYKLITCEYLAKLSVARSREQFKRRITDKLRELQFQEEVVADVEYINVRRMEKKIISFGQAVYCSANDPQKHTTVFNICYESIRAGFCQISIDEILMRLKSEHDLVNS